MTESFEWIESETFCYRANLASGGEQFIQVIGSDPRVRELATTARKQRDQAARITQRVLQITCRAVDYRYENPYDAALCAYLFVLRAVHPDLARLAATAVRRAENCWWSAFFARTLLMETPVDAAVVNEKTKIEGTRFSTRTPDQVVLGEFGLLDRPVFETIRVEAGSSEQSVSHENFSGCSARPSPGVAGLWYSATATKESTRRLAA